MVRCVGWMYGPFHHGPHIFPCSLYIPCAHYNDVLEIPTLNVLAYHMRCWQSLGSYFFFSECIALGLRLGIRFFYNLNWTKKPLPLGPPKMMSLTPSLPMLCSCLGPFLSDYYIPCLSGDCKTSRICLKAWGMSWGLGSASEISRMISTRLGKN